MFYMENHSVCSLGTVWTKRSGRASDVNEAPVYELKVVAFVICFFFFFSKINSVLVDINKSFQVYVLVSLLCT